MRYATLALILCLLCASLVVAAGTPGQINYQGVLRDAGGEPEDGTFDMRFRLFDAVAAGNEVVVDQHVAAGTGGVVVAGGLFSVALGSGNVTDGSGPGSFTSFVDAFAQYAAVWLEIEVAGETLVPRVPVLSSAYAINARLFQGRDAGEFLDTSATPQEKTGLITASGGIDFGAGPLDDLDAGKVSTLTGGGNADALHTHTLVGQATNAGLLDSIDSSQFLRSDTDDTYTTGTLTLAAGTVLNAKGQVRLDGSLYMDADGPDGTQAIYFFDQASNTGEAFAWNDALDRFTLSNTLRLENGFGLEVTGETVALNTDGPDATQTIYFYDGGEPLGQSLSWDDAAGRFALSRGARFEGSLATADNLEVDGTLISVGTAGPDQDQTIGFYDNGQFVNERLSWENTADRFLLTNDLAVTGSLDISGAALSMGTLGAETNQSFYFFEDGSPVGELVGWDDAQDRFEVTDDLAITGTLRTGSTITAAVTYNTLGSGTPGSGDMTGTTDLFISSDLEVGDQIYVGGANYIEWNTSGSNFYFSEGVHIGDTVGENVVVGGNRIYLGAGLPSEIPLEFVGFAAGTFTMTDDLDVFGVFTAGSKNFVQNHPYDEGLEIVYTTLEGPEAATFTRGSARLRDGVARVPLNESFAWVTHPDLGLTVSLTPRGAWADLFVEKVSTGELVVRAAPGSPPDAAFDYLVLGLRVGLEEAPAVRPRHRDARLPDPANLRASISGRPELARFTPLARYRAAAGEAFGVEINDLSAGDALRNAIGTDPEVGSRGDSRESANRETGMASPEISPAESASEDVVSIGAKSPAISRRSPGAGSSYEDEQGNLYARSFRPNSGGLDAISPALGDVDEGDVVTLDRSALSLRRSESAEDSTVVGIATGATRAGADGSSSVPFAVAGIVVCKVDAAYGAIVPGDLLVTSATPGHAMRVDAPESGTVVGKALEPLPAGTGMIRVLVMLR